jgi:hypothetical protein
VRQKRAEAIPHLYVVEQLSLLSSNNSLAPSAGRRELDQWFSPEWAAWRLLDTYFSDLSGNDFVVDAGCGRGAFLKAVPAQVRAIGVEIDSELAAEARANTGRDVHVGDFRSIALPAGVTTVIGNPPFSRAVVEGFIDRAGAILPENGRCGFILPSSYVSFSSTLERLAQTFSVRADILPRNLFPRIQVPISFYLFTKEHVRKHHGFVLFEEAGEISGMPKNVKLALYRGANRESPWHTAVKEVMRSLGGRATLSQIYESLQGKLPRPITTWKDTVRRTLQEGKYENVGRGEWALPSPT